MKNIIERYIYAVVRRLPENSQVEITEELKANIYDMLPDNPSEEQITKVLIDLGSPRDLAVKYQPKERYVISPRYYDDYLYTLKIVGMILVLISMASTLIEGILAPVETELFEHIVTIIATTLGSAFQGLLGAFTIVTIIFWIIEQTQLRTSKCEWKISDLPELPSQNTLKISRTETIFEIVFQTVFSVIFIMILANYHTLIGYYSEMNQLVPFFNPDVLEPFVILFIISLIASLVISMMKLIHGVWSRGLAVVVTIYELLQYGVMILFLTLPNLVHPDFFSTIANEAGIGIQEVSLGYETVLRIIIIVITVITIITIGSLWLKIIKNGRKTVK